MGRKPLPPKQRRVKIHATVKPETARALARLVRESGAESLGRWLDSLMDEGQASVVLGNHAERIERFFRNKNDLLREQIKELEAKLERMKTK